QPDREEIMTNGRLVLGSFLCTAVLGGGPQDSTHRLDYPALAQGFLSGNGLKAWVAGGPGEHTFQEALDGPAFGRGLLGALDVRAPKEGLANNGLAEEFRTTVKALLDIQAEWFAWRMPDKAATYADDWKNLGKWVKGWSNGKLAHADGGKSLLDSLDAGES